MKGDPLIWKLISSLQITISQTTVRFRQGSNDSRHQIQRGDFCVTTCCDFEIPSTIANKKVNSVTLDYGHHCRTTCEMKLGKQNFCQSFRDCELAGHLALIIQLRMRMHYCPLIWPARLLAAHLLSEVKQSTFWLQLMLQAQFALLKKTGDLLPGCPHFNEMADFLRWSKFPEFMEINLLSGSGKNFERERNRIILASKATTKQHSLRMPPRRWNSREVQNTKYQNVHPSFHTSSSEEKPR